MFQCHYSSGGKNGSASDGSDVTDQILEFLPSTKNWTVIDTMRKNRYAHAVTTISLAKARHLYDANILRKQIQIQEQKLNTVETKLGTVEKDLSTVESKLTRTRFVKELACIYGFMNLIETKNLENDVKSFEDFTHTFNVAYVHPSALFSSLCF